MCIRDSIKAASPNTLVGVDVNPGNYPSWDPIVLKNAPYDFVEYHYYPETPGQESDSFLVNSGAQGLTNTINTIKSELNTAGKQGTPIYVGEIGGPYSNPGKQSWSITQGPVSYTHLVDGLFARPAHDRRPRPRCV